MTAERFIQTLRSLDNGQIIFLTFDADMNQIGRLTADISTAMDWADARNVEWVA